MLTDPEHVGIQTSEETHAGSQTVPEERILNLYTEKENYFCTNAAFYKSRQMENKNKGLFNSLIVL